MPLHLSEINSNGKKYLVLPLLFIPLILNGSVNSFFFKN